MIKLLLHDKRIYEDGSIQERIVWIVPMSERNPEGVRYRLVFIPKGALEPSVLYDNHHPKGHHKHIYSDEFLYDFSGIEKLLADFKKDIEEVKRR